MPLLIGRRRSTADPRAWQVVLVLEELQVPYEIESIKFEDIKKAPFINLNPNGRVPGKSSAAFHIDGYTSNP